MDGRSRLAVRRNQQARLVDAEGWRRVQDIFHAALERDPNQRSAFLDRACDGNPDIRAEVASLLANHDRASSFLNDPSLVDDAEFMRGSGPILAAGRPLGPYIIEGEIGRGGMGVIYLARDTRLGRQVALKTLPAVFSLDARRRERLRVEARAAARLSHPGIATVFALEEFEGALWIAFEYVPGRTLRQVLLDRGPLSPDDLLRVASQMADALAAAHARGIIHRDLKPENVVLTEDGRIKILDFGLARLLHASRDERLTIEGTIIGTPAYMAPEQLQGQDVDFAADLFSFGVILYELARGAHPFAGNSVKSVAAHVPQIELPESSQTDPHTSTGLVRIIGTCLQIDPRQRYRSTTDLVLDLEALRNRTPLLRPGADSPVMTQPSHQPMPLNTRWWRFHQLAVAAVYPGILYPAWTVRGGIPLNAGKPLFFLLLTVIVAATSLRLNLWFTSQFHPAGLTRQRNTLRTPIRVMDWAVAALLFGFGLFAAAGHPAAAAALVIASVANVVAFLVIEPATTRAAFPPARSGSPRRRPSPKSPRTTS
jgi:predicted Ser/Thr protein kinase